MATVLTLAEARTRDAREGVTVADLEAFRDALKAKIIGLVEAEYARTQFAWIADPDTSVLSDYIEQGLGDCFFPVEQEIES